MEGSQTVFHNPEPIPSPIEIFITKLVSVFPRKEPKIWARAFFRSTSAYEENKNDHSVNDATRQFAMVGMFYVFIAVMALLPHILIGTIDKALDPGGSFSHWLIAAAIVVVFAPISAIVFGYAGSAVYFAIARVLGGTGSFKDHSFAFSLLYGSSTLLAEAPITLIAAIPSAITLSNPAGAFLGIELFLLGLAVIRFILNCYVWLYNNYKMMRLVHGLTPRRALAVVFIPPTIMLVAFILMFALAVLVLGMAFLNSGLLSSVNNAMV